MPRFWTPDRIDVLADLLTKPLTFRQIAEQIGCERNAALGQAFRSRVAGDPRFLVRYPGKSFHVRRLRASDKPKPAAPRPEKRPREPLPPKRFHVVRPTPEQVEVDLSMPPVGKRIWDLGRRECHFVVGPGDYCARACHPLSPYCAAHHVLVYRPSTSRAA